MRVPAAATRSKTHLTMLPPVSAHHQIHLHASPPSPRSQPAPIATVRTSLFVPRTSADAPLLSPFPSSTRQRVISFRASTNRKQPFVLAALIEPSPPHFDRCCQYFTAHHTHSTSSLANCFASRSVATTLNARVLAAHRFAARAARACWLAPPHKHLYRAEMHGATHSGVVS